MATQKHSKLTQYLMSERFQENMRRGIAKAIAETRAAGLEPAGDRRIKGPSGPPIVTFIAAPKPSDRAKPADDGSKECAGEAGLRKGRD
ncbi:hypothetical protein [Cupriavidus basilensis]|uniref:hypothetical protein n=1 Tax=Cupriavidus basilensis TaxID=68895 RepID=UPI00157AECBD|nr:hypothetical protein [Cupriavidus basilensis]NUA26305.1 hypothetical protein [Cupriavidus basilensis]